MKRHNRITVPGAEEFDELKDAVAKLQEEIGIINLVLRHIGWIGAQQVMDMKLPGLSTWKGLNSAADRGDLVIDKSKKKARVSVKSLLDLLRKKGYLHRDTSLPG
ncbi:hypothetical protein MKJ04_14475 [Pontibacter sp. E15-1]|uniref:hypothetical protein n=1 Tax=Pontibacter sp. E15-1 TaxID=2919918 RepID=UPI001F4FAE30|nr:hypothetical protein [Pontibacter sp. E15-1]MCJ8166049.1 hypothetical protein [Pontibacter sp. E15-1]